MGFKKRFTLAVGEKLERFIPILPFYLKRAGIEETPREFIGKIIVDVFTLNLTIIVGVLVLNLIVPNLPIGLMISLIIMWAGFYMWLMLNQPKAITQRRIKNLEINLQDAIDSLSEQINAGIPLYEAINNIARSNDYGELSKEFAEAVRMIDQGEKEEEALEKLLIFNPSRLFQEALRPIINSLRSGGNIGNTLRAVTREITELQMNETRDYGQRLNVYVMIYTLTVVIIPSLLGIFINVLISFITLSKLNAYIIYFGILFYSAMANIFFMGRIKSMRPSVSKDD